MVLYHKCLKIANQSFKIDRLDTSRTHSGTIRYITFSALRKAITYGKLVEGVDVCKFGKQWVVSTEAMKREYSEPRI